MSRTWGRATCSLVPDPVPKIQVPSSRQRMAVCDRAEGIWALLAHFFTTSHQFKLKFKRTFQVHKSLFIKRTFQMFKWSVPNQWLVKRTFKGPREPRSFNSTHVSLLLVLLAPTVQQYNFSGKKGTFSAFLWRRDNVVSPQLLGAILTNCNFEFSRRKIQSNSIKLYFYIKIQIFEICTKISRKRRKSTWKSLLKKPLKRTQAHFEFQV